MNVKATINTQDMQRIRELLSSLEPKAKAAAMKAIRGEATALLAHAQTLVPVQTGALQASGRVIETQKEISVIYRGQAAIRAYLGAAFAGAGLRKPSKATTDYAIFVHEIPPGQRGHSPKGYKWLERAARAVLPVSVQRIGHAIKTEVFRK